MVLFDFSRGEKPRKINTLLYVALTLFHIQFRTGGNDILQLVDSFPYSFQPPHFRNKKPTKKY